VIHKTEAIVLQVRNYSESSKIITCLTDKYGKLTLIAKGARRIKSQFGAGLDLFSHSEIVFYMKESRQLQTISQCTPRKVFGQLQQSIVKLAYASALTELTNLLIVDSETEAEPMNQMVFELLKSALLLVERTPENALPQLLWAFQLRMAEILGYRPEFETCLACHTNATEIQIAFVPTEGRIYHLDCLAPRLKSGALFLSQGTLKTLRYLQAGSLHRVSRLRITEPILSQCKKVLNTFASYHMPHAQTLKSLSYIHKLNN